MKAMVRQAYGPPQMLELKDVAKPVPQPDEVSVQVHAAGVSIDVEGYVWLVDTFSNGAYKFKVTRVSWL